MNYDNIPDEMKALNQWACYKTYKDKITGKYKKIIISAVTGDCAHSDKQSTWTGYEYAKGFCEFNRYAGLAFALYEGVTFIDLDHTIDKTTGKIVSDTANKILAKFPETFCERSLSGSGIHILARGSLPEGALKRNDKIGLEMYDTKRFVCMTGDLIGASISLKDYTDEICKVNHKYIGERKVVKSCFFGGACIETDSELIAQIQKSKAGDRFNKLYSGNLAGYESHSNADYDFAKLLAWWTSDVYQIDRIIRSSGLYREKWDRRLGNSTYGLITIENAITATPNTRNKIFKTSAMEM